MDASDSLTGVCPLSVVLLLVNGADFFSFKNNLGVYHCLISFKCCDIAALLLFLLHQSEVFFIFLLHGREIGRSLLNHQTRRRLYLSNIVLKRRVFSDNVDIVICMINHFIIWREYSFLLIIHRC